jgi:phosphoribosylformylglycinamidine (FGAM) synthase-like enzyme
MILDSQNTLTSYHEIEASPAPDFNLDFEYKLQSAVLELIDNELINSAHDVSNGGLYMTLVESSLYKNLGFDITTDAEIRTDAFLFGESQSRIVVTCSEENETAFIDLLLKLDIPFSALGHVTKGELRIDDTSFGFISDAKKVFEETLAEHLEG